MTAVRGPIVQVTPYYPPHLGGMENVAESIAAALAERGPVEVLTTTCGAGDAPRAESRPNLRVRRLRAVELAHTPIAPSLLWHLLRLPKSALVHVHIAQALVPEMVWLASAIRRRPFIAHFHLDVEPSGPLGAIFRLYKRGVLGSTLRAARRVIVLSKEQAAFVTETYGVDPAAVDVLPNGVSDAFLIDRRTGPRSTGRLRLLCVGRLTAQKNMTRLLHAIAQVTAPVELVIAGEGEERPALERTIAELGLTNVYLVGAQTGPALVDRYAWADAFVLASDREGMPLVVLEAMAAGLAIITTDVPGTRELTSGVGLLTGCSPAELAAAIDRVALDRDLLAQLAHASRTRGATRTWAGLMPDLRAVYEAAR